MRSGFLKDTTELRKLILENPELPITVLCDGEICLDDCHWWFAPHIACRIGEVLDCEQEINEERIYHDRDDFEEALADMISYVYEDLSQEEFEQRLKIEMENFEPYWKKCILIFAGL